MSANTESTPTSVTPASVAPADFRRQLLREHAYHTASRKVRAPAWPSWRYHGIVFGCVWRGARKVRRGEYDRAAWEASSARILLAVERLGGRIEIDGLAPLAALKRPFIVASNHMSALETHALACILQPFRDVTFVVKRSLLAYPMFGAILRTIDPIPVSRARPREDLRTVLREGARRLADGVAPILFPQSRRRIVFRPEEFNSIACKLAARTGAPLVPLALKTDFLDYGFPIPDLGRVHPERTARFAFGDPIEARGREKDAHRETVAFIADHLLRWSGPAPSGGEHA